MKVEVAAAGEIEGRALGVRIAIDLGDGQGVIGVGIGIRAERAGENIAKPAGDVFGNGKQVVPGHGIVIQPRDG